MYYTLPSSAVAKLLLTSPITSVDLKIAGEYLAPSSTAHHHKTVH